MQTLEVLSLTLALLGYVWACAFYLIYAFNKKESLTRWGYGVLTVTVLFHGLDLVARVVVARGLSPQGLYVPWSNGFESLSLFVFLISAIFLVGQLGEQLPILGAFVLPWTWVLLGLAFACPVLALPQWRFISWAELLRILKTAPDISTAPLTSYWMAVHVPVMFAAYALLTNAFGVGLAYVVEERQMKSKKPSPLAYRLPPLEDMDRLIYRLILWAFPLLTLGILLGARWAHDAWGRYWGWDAKETWAFITWLVYLGYLHARLGLGWRGRRTAIFSLAAFGVVLFTYIGINSFSRLHGFLSAGTSQ